MKYTIIYQSFESNIVINNIKGALISPAFNQLTKKNKRNTMKTPIKIESIEINLITPKEFVTIWKDGEYINPTEGDLIEIFEAEPFHYASVLEGSYNLHAFNTSNYGSPVTLCGIYDENFDIALVNFHRGGDIRGNYGSSYIIEGYDNVTALISQQTELTIELSNGETFRQYCENSEAYYNFNTFNIDLIDIEEFYLNDEMYNELTENMELVK